MAKKKPRRQPVSGVRKLTVRLPAELARRLKLVAVDADKPVNDLVVELIEARTAGADLAVRRQPRRPIRPY